MQDQNSEKKERYIRLLISREQQNTENMTHHTKLEMHLEKATCQCRWQKKKKKDARV